MLAGLTARPASIAPYMCFARIRPVSLLISISATAAPYDARWVPTPIPRPVAIFAFDGFDAARLGAHLAACETASRTPSQRASLILRCWTIVIPTVLVPAHELQANRFAGCLRENRGCLRHVVVAAMAVSARSFAVLHSNFLGDHSKQARHAGARPVHILRRADDQRGLRRHIGERAVWSEGGVRLVWAPAGLRDSVSGPCECACHIAPLQHDPLLGFGRTHLFVEAVVAGQRWRRVPRHFQLLGGANGVPFAFGDNADEIATTHHASFRDVSDGGLVDAQDLCAGAVGTLAARANDAAMHHVRYTHVLNVDIFSAYFFRSVFSLNKPTHHFVLGGRLQRSRPGEREVERLVAHELAVGHGPVRASHDRNDTLRHGQALNGRFQLLGRELEKGEPRLGGGRANLWPASGN